MRAAFSCFVAGVGLLACAAAPGLPPDFTRELARGEAGAGRIELRGARIETVSAPIAEADLPERVVVAVEAIQPGGTTVEVSRVWRGDLETFSVTKSYGEGAAAQRRSALLTAGGEVIERTHEIPISEVQGAAHRAVTALSRGSIRRVEVVQPAPGVERYRFWLGQADRSSWVVECSLAGEQVQVARCLEAEVRAWQ